MTTPCITGVCSRCGKDVPVDDEGLVKNHGFHRSSRTVQTPGRGTAIVCGSFPCEGSGRKPAKVVRG